MKSNRPLIVDQPLDGLLYDLDLLPEQVKTTRDAMLLETVGTLRGDYETTKSALDRAHQVFGHEMDMRAKEIGILNSRIENYHKEAEDYRDALEWIASLNPDGCCGNDDGEECVHERAGRVLGRYPQSTSFKKKCPHCQGEKRVLYIYDRPGSPQGNAWIPCPICSAPDRSKQGRKVECERCDGKGTVEAMCNPNEIAGPFTKFIQVPCPRCEGRGVLE